MWKKIAVVVVALLAIGGGTATAHRWITGADIKDGSLSSRELTAGAIDYLRNGPPGPQGPKGDKGDKGDPATGGAAVRIVRATTGFRALCAADEVATGGGYYIVSASPGTGDIVPFFSRPVDDGGRAAGWEISPSSIQQADVYALCAKGTAVVPEQP